MDRIGIGPDPLAARIANRLIFAFIVMAGVVGPALLLPGSGASAAIVSSVFWGSIGGYAVSRRWCSATSIGVSPEGLAVHRTSGQADVVSFGQINAIERWLEWGGAAYVVVHVQRGSSVEAVAVFEQRARDRALEIISTCANRRAQAGDAVIGPFCSWSDAAFRRSELIPAVVLVIATGVSVLAVGGIGIPLAAAVLFPITFTAARFARIARFRQIRYVKNGDQWNKQVGRDERKARTFASPGRYSHGPTR